MDNNANDGPRATRVLIVERSPRLAIGITQILDKSELVKVAGRTEDPKRLMELVEALQPEVVLLNSDRPGSSLVDLCGALRGRKIGVVLLSTESQRGPVRDALEAGAHAIVAWPCRPRELVLAIINAARVSRGTGNLSMMPEDESEVASDEGLITGKLSPLMEWASRSDAEKVSSRLKQGPGTGERTTDGEMC
jgi:DNA-binding NarL/FixJ family response regulator